MFVGGRDVLLPHQAIRKQMEEYGKHITCIYGERWGGRVCVCVCLV